MTTRAPADSPCESDRDLKLVAYLFGAMRQFAAVGDEESDLTDDLDVIWDDLGADRQDMARIFALGLNAREHGTAAAPPVLSARPNEAEQAISRVESAYPESVFPEDGTSIDCQSASVARLTCRNIRYELKRIIDERDENEADAPRGQAVAFQVLYADKTIELQWADDSGERDDYGDSDERHGDPVNITPLYRWP